MAGVLVASPGQAATAPNRARPDLAGVAEVDLPAAADTLLVVLSGDGGWWGDLDRRLAERLAAAGYGVLGVDTQVWFKDEQTPAAVAARLDAVLDAYLARLGARSIVLVGYSFGADLLPVVYPLLGADTRDRVRALALLAPGRSTQLHVTLAERTGLASGGIALAPLYAALPRDGLICLSGEDERAATGCTLPELADATQLSLPGGHHFDGDVEHIAAALLPILGRAAPP